MKIPPDISVLITTRKRVEMLDSMLQSLMATAVSMERVEVVMRCDDDDDATINYLRAWHHSFIVGPKPDMGYASLGALVNETARLSHAPLAIVVNDDAKFVTHGWDRKLIEAAQAFPDGIYDLGVDTVMNNPNYVWPCTSRRVIDLIGIHHDLVIYNDIWLRDVMAPFGRAIRVEDVVIAHEWAGISDSQRRAIHITQTPAYQELYAQCVEEARHKVATALKQEA